MMVESVIPSLQGWIVLYLFESKHLLDNYINLYRDLFDQIKSSPTYFDYMQSTHQADIIQIIVYYKIVKKELSDKTKAYNNKIRIV